MLWCTVGLATTFGFAALTLDVSRFRLLKGELRTLADAAALSAAHGIVDGTFYTRANAVAAENRVDGAPASLPVSAVVRGNWSNGVFTANGTPSNAVRVTVLRTKATGTAVSSYLGSAVGWSSPDLTATSIAALVNQSTYEWASAGNTSLNGGGAFKITAYDAGNPSAPESLANVRAGGSLSVGGGGTINANLTYGTSSNINGSGGGSIAGSVTQNSTAATYISPTSTAYLNGATTAASSSLSFSTNTTVPGGTYAVKDLNAQNCTVSFTGPTTLVVEGTISLSHSAFQAYGNLPSNLKIIMVTPGSTISISNPTAPLYADWYAPNASLDYSAASGYEGLRGRGVFGSIAVTGSGSSLWYDRSMNGTSESRKVLLVN